MPRFFTEGLPEQQPGGQIIITGEDARHISASLRMRPGEEVEICDGRLTDYFCVITGVSAEQAEMQVIRRAANTAELPATLKLFIALPKSDKMELIIQKAVELGASHVVAVLTNRCIARPKPQEWQAKLPRMQKIARAAAMQSGRGVIPQVERLHSYSEALEAMRRHEQAALFYEAGGQPLRDIIAPGQGSVALLVGSEGGFEPAEVTQAQEQGICIATLGPRILRCETAAIAACALAAELLG